MNSSDYNDDHAAHAGEPTTCDQAIVTILLILQLIDKAQLIYFFCATKGLF